MAQLELGLALVRGRRGIEAIAALRRAVALKPDLPQGLAGPRRPADGRWTMSRAPMPPMPTMSAIPRAIRRLLQAATALVENRMPEAEALLREHLKQAPTDVAAIRMLAEVAARLGRNEDAENLLARCLRAGAGLPRGAPELRPASCIARTSRRRRWPRSSACSRDEPDNPGYRNLKAVVLCRIGDYETAIGLYAAILAAHIRTTRGSG